MPTTTIPENAAAGYSLRLHYIDNLRVLLISLIVLLHLAITYGAPGGWYVHEVQFESLGIGSMLVFIMYNATVQAFALGFFFFLSGYFTASSLERKGLRRFTLDRLVRLGIPLAVYMVVIEPVLVYALHARGEPFVPFILGRFARGDLSTGPMWFVAALLLFTGIYIAWMRMKGSTPGGSGETAAELPGNARLFLLAFTAGVVAFAIRLVFPVGWSMPVLNFQFSYFTMYVILFFLGTAAWRIRWFEHAGDRNTAGWLGFTCAVVFFLPFLILLGSGGSIGAFNGGLHWEAAAYALWEPFVCLGAVMGLSALFARRFNRGDGWVGKLSPGAYAVYVIHPVVLIALTALFAGLALPPVAKFLVMSPVVLAGCFAAALLLRTLPGVKKVL